ncbi:MAG: MiaB/RimO family radical SAM methylthiotransferase, partial [Eggerthellaceae bacterium]|nr:MiaB/RimO family radical SAM methylthiotransferase [Eggerthellaceae bacterium]
MLIKLVHLGCKVTRVEIDAAAAELIAAGARMDEDGNPDVVLVNTCTVTGEADKKTRKAVRQALKSYPGAQVLVTGCAAVMNPAWFTDLDERIHVVPKPQLAQQAWELAGYPLHSFAPISDNAGSVPHLLRTGGVFRTRVGIKAQDGCNNACTYCIVHVARGTSRSVPFDEVVADARAHAAAGVRELVLTGINLGAYDDGGRRLPELLEALLEACPESRLRVGSVEPCDVDDALIELMAAADGRICRHLHLPLQSGSSRVLAEMNRPYDAAFFADLVKRLRSAMPSFALSTDIIVGFPGETEDDFAQTVELAREVRFGKIHVVRYSKREGTPAAQRPDQVDPDVIA